MIKIKKLVQKRPLLFSLCILLMVYVAIGTAVKLGIDMPKWLSVVLYLSFGLWWVAIPFVNFVLKRK